MQREILFRGKRTDNGEWVEGFLVEASEDAYILDAPADFSWGDNGHKLRIGCFKKVGPATVGQYTGLTDKNGVKIFEGDIVCNDEPEDMEWKPLPVFGEVKFGEYDGDILSLEYPTKSHHVGFFVDWKDNEDGDYSEDFRRDLGYWVKYPHFAVCGNIHDNPELLSEDLQ